LTVIFKNVKICLTDLEGYFNFRNLITQFKEELRMHTSKVTKLILSLLIVLGVLLSACTQAVETEAPPEEPAAEEPVAEEPEAEEPEAGELTLIKFASFAGEEALPIYVAQQEGLLAKHGVEADIIPVASAQEKEQLVAVGEANCEQGELLTVITANQDEIIKQNLFVSIQPSETHPKFTILVAGDSGIEDIEGLKGVEIGTSENSIVEYITHRILERNGFSKEDIKFLSVPRIPDRLALIQSGELKAGSMQSSLADMAVQEGAVIIADDRNYPDITQMTWACRKDFIDANPEAVKGFIAAIAEAVEIINKDPQAYKGLAVENNLIPVPLQETYVMPEFPLPAVPTREGFEDVYQWALEKGIVTNENIAYEDTIRPELLP
jgi:NitT/TauT family transport system substrate-binding protein